MIYYFLAGFIAFIIMVIIGSIAFSSLKNKIAMIIIIIILILLSPLLFYFSLWLVVGLTFYFGF